MKKETLAQAFSCEFCVISKNTFFPEDLRWLLLIFAVEFVEILFCYKPMVVTRKLEYDKNFFFVILFKISKIVSHMIEYGIIIKTCCVQY